MCAVKFEQKRFLLRIWNDDGVACLFVYDVDCCACYPYMYIIQYCPWNIAQLVCPTLFRVLKAQDFHGFVKKKERLKCNYPLTLKGERYEYERRWAAGGWIGFEMLRTFACYLVRCPSFSTKEMGSFMSDAWCYMSIFMHNEHGSPQGNTQLWVLVRCVILLMWRNITEGIITLNIWWNQRVFDCSSFDFLIETFSWVSQVLETGQWLSKW